MGSRPSFADKVLAFYSSVAIKEKLPPGVEILNPYQDEIAFNLCKQFYQKFYNDANERIIIFGINPGRFGGGITGIPFTDPVKLEKICGIKNELQKKVELSADFIYAMIDGLGGIEKFYRKFYINSVSPLGFTFESKNLNYYDTPALKKSLEAFILRSMETQINFGVNRKTAFCLGEGENFKYLSALNNAKKYFGEIVPLAHPRFVMQYKRKFIAEYIKDYKLKLTGKI